MGEHLVANELAKDDALAQGVRPGVVFIG